MCKHAALSSVVECINQKAENVTQVVTTFATIAATLDQFVVFDQVGYHCFSCFSRWWHLAKFGMRELNHVSEFPF